MITLCPYSLKPLVDLPAEELSDEHIIPHALGGPNSLVLRAERSSNSKFGETVDSDLVHDGMLRFVAATQGVRSLSCIPTVFCLLRQRPLVGRGTRRDGLASHLRLNNGRFEPFNPSVDVFQRIGIHR